MPTQVDETSVDRLRRELPPVVVDAAADYAVAGRVTALTRLGDRIGGRVRGHNGIYRVAIDLTDPPTYACDCGRGQPCRHAVALAIVWAREPAGFTDLVPLLDSWRSEAAAGALRHVVDRCFGPKARDSADALLELATVSADADPLRLETYLDAVAGLAVVGRQRAPALIAELRERAAVLSRRQGRTTAVRALTALVVASGRLLARPGWAGPDLLAEADAAARDLDLLLERGGLDADVLVASLRLLGDALHLLPAELLAPVLNAGSRMTGEAGAFLVHRLHAAVESAEAELALSPGDAVAAERVRELTTAIVQFLLSLGRDDEALALARARGRETAGALPLVEVLAGCGRRGEAIAAARDALGRAVGSDVGLIRRRLAELLRQDGKPEQALAYLAANFNEHPGTAGYIELRGLALECDNWDELRDEALTRLRVAGDSLDYAEAAVVEARAIEGGASDAARDLLAGALLSLPAAPAGEQPDDDRRRGIQLLFREARRLFRRLNDETGWRRLREECRQRYGIQ